VVWAFAIVVATAGVCEWSLRRAGHRPSFEDDPTWWAYHRRKVDGDPRAVALLGTSRMLLAVSHEALDADRTGYHFVQLAINGSSPLGTLEDLAADTDFTGVAIVDLAEWDVTPEAWHTQDRWIAAYHRFWRAPGAFANAWIRGRVREHLAILGLDGRLVIASALRDRAWPEPRWVISRRDRFRVGDYSIADKKKLELQREKNLGWVPAVSPAPEAWLAEMARVERAVERIQARGGRVVILRTPTSGEQWRVANERFPRPLYWDRFAASTEAIALHFKDMPEIADIVCPDDAHLDQRDQSRFSHALVAALRARGALR
jgi:hypothetical protein